MTEGVASSTPSAPSQPTGGNGASPSASPQQNPGSHQQHSSPNSQKQTAPDSSNQQQQLREYKINGKIVRMTQKEADDYVSMSYAAQERFNEAAKMRKEFEKIDQQYSKNPLKAFLDYAQKAKLSPEQTRQAIEDFYAKQYIEPETLTAEQRRLRELEEWKQQREKEDQERFMTEQQKQERQMTDEQINHVTQEIVSALERAQLPQKNKFLVQRMAFYMHQNNVNGWNAPPEMVLKQVVNEHRSIVGDFLKDATMDQLISYAGQEFIDKILKHSLENLRQKRTQREEPFSGSGRHYESNPGGKVDMSEVNRRLRDMRLGKF